MSGTVSAPQSPTEWLIFAVGVFFIVSTAVFLTTENFVTSIEMGVSSMAITVGLATALVFTWRRVSPIITR
ncbi:hypothetical protein SAMN05216388_101691 [Halorientalis persicus]|uniref:Uncharacterized protein n=1 Tax=Halorientalis persicus TaxID=1367881 RepID=A0A1H8RKA5_9EURY|nr:hypothetical protein [Halorientalis persicus]SEO66697.1 hypothetical protein SAMN05216388_101691 [Halorientalis persicus]